MSNYEWRVNPEPKGPFLNKHPKYVVPSLCLCSCSCSRIKNVRIINMTWLLYTQLLTPVNIGSQQVIPAWLVSAQFACAMQRQASRVTRHVKPVKRRFASVPMPMRKVPPKLTARASGRVVKGTNPVRKKTESALVKLWIPNLGMTGGNEACHG